jgi:hypothetical protein
MPQPTTARVIEFPADNLYKQVPCDKCGCELTVPKSTILAFCRDCSAGMAVKK